MKGILNVGISISVIVLVIVGVAKVGLLPRGTPFDYFAPESAFVREWKGVLRDCGTVDLALAALRKNKEGGQVVRMADGSWVAVVMEHACCTGAGFNATLYVTSGGISYLDADTCYCSFTPLSGEIYTHDKKTVVSFLASVRSSGKSLAEL